MTEIVSTRFLASAGERDGMGFHLRASGHATGGDGACAAVSALLYTLAGWAVNAQRTPDAGLTAGVSFGEEAQAELLLLAETKEAQDAALAIWEMTLIGLLQLETKYPQALKVTDQEFGVDIWGALRGIAAAHVPKSAEATLAPPPTGDNGSPQVAPPTAEDSGGWLWKG